MPLADYQTLVANLVRDAATEISTAQRDEAIALAVTRYSKDRPRILVADLVSAGGNLLDLPAGWEAEFSELRSLEYPIGEVPPTYIANEFWRLYQQPAAIKIQLDDALAAAAQVRSSFTVRHTLDAGTDTIPVKDREPVAAWGASILCDQLAALFSGQQLTTIPADSVDHKTRAEEYAARARNLRTRYFNELGIDPKRSVAAAAVVNLDLQDSRGSTIRLTHPRAYR